MHDQGPDCRLPNHLHFLGTLQTRCRPTHGHLHTQGGWDPWERAVQAASLLPTDAPLLECSAASSSSLCPHSTLCWWGHTPRWAPLPVPARPPDPESTVGLLARASRGLCAPADRLSSGHSDGHSCRHFIAAQTAHRERRPRSAEKHPRTGLRGGLDSSQPRGRRRGAERPCSCRWQTHRPPAGTRVLVPPEQL